MEFRKRVVAAVEPVPVEKQWAADAEDEEQVADASVELIVRRGRRTGVRMKKDIPRDAHGLEKLNEFWMAEEQSTRLSLASSKAGSAVTDSSILSHRSSTADSFADDHTIDASAETQVEDDSEQSVVDNSMSDASRTPASTDRSIMSSAKSRASASVTPSSAARSSTRSSAALTSFTPSSTARSSTHSSAVRSSVGRSSAVRSSAASVASSLLDSPSDTKLVDDSPSGGLDASKQRLTFGSSDKRLSTLSADSISPSESERAMKRRSRVSFAESGSKRKSSVSFAKTPRGRDSTATVASQAPLIEQEDDHENDMADALRYVFVFFFVFVHVCAAHTHCACIV